MIRPKRIRKISTRKGSTLFIIVLLFASSGVLRFAAHSSESFEFGAAFAQSNQSETKSEEPTTYTNEQINGLIEAFAVREERVATKELQIQKRMRALEIAEEAVTKKIEQLKSVEKNLRATMALASTAAEDDLARLTTVYENMKPKTASAMFEEMDPTFAAGFLGRMRPDAAAAVMAGMTPQKAYSISAILAGRNADVPTE